MTLWGVRVTTSDDDVTVRFPTDTRDDAVESAGRINDWIAHMAREHPGQVPHVVAEVAAWAEAPDLHARELAATKAFMAEEQEDL